LEMRGQVSGISTKFKMRGQLVVFQISWRWDDKLVVF
jgi:hypothetical protein